MALGKLIVSKNGRFLMQEDGEPFFWLGDTAWLLFNRLNKKEAEYFLEVRRQQGFNVIQVMGIHSLPIKNFYGNEPFINNDVSKPVRLNDSAHEGYWEHVDDIIDIAEQKGLYIAIVPVWGSVVKAGKASVEQARTYGTWLGERFCHRPNIIWLNGGDVRGDVCTEVWDALGESIKAVANDQLMTFHPFGRTQSSIWFHDRSWLDFNMFQSGHRRYGQGGQDGDNNHYGQDNWRYVENDYNKEPIKPTIDGEPSYEQIPQGLHDPSEPWWQAHDVRRYAYWSVFAGAFGHTYGHSSVMQMHRKEYSDGDYGAKKFWDKAIFDEGAVQMQHLKNLIAAYPFFIRIPDQSVLASEQGEKYERVAITRGNDYLFAYTYTGRQFELHMGVIKGSRVKAFWYDPRTGERIKIGVLENNGTAAFDPPGKHSAGNDWVLVLETVSNRD